MHATSSVAMAHFSLDALHSLFIDVVSQINRDMKFISRLTRDSETMEREGDDVNRVLKKRDRELNHIST